jgi:hypothetical protein
MKKYLTLIFTILLMNTFSFYGQVLAEQINMITITSVSAALSNPGYISFAGRENIVVEGVAPAGSTVTVVLSDSANPTNEITGSQTLSLDSTTYHIGLNGGLALPEALHDGLIKVSASFKTSSYSRSSSGSATASIIQETVAPTITIIGDNPFSCRVRYTCPDLGAVALDSFGNKLPFTASSNVKENIVGNYTVTYNTLDLAGNIAANTRRVNVSTRSSGLSSTIVDIPTTPVVIQIPVATPTPAIIETAPIATATQPVVVAPAPIVSVAKVSGIVNIIKKQLRYGVSGADVKLLQTLLSRDPSIYPEGLATGYFGNATKKAVQKFQEKYNIVLKGKAGYGELGPKTKLKFIELYGE